MKKLTPGQIEMLEMAKRFTDKRIAFTVTSKEWINIAISLTFKKDKLLVSGWKSGEGLDKYIVHKITAAGRKALEEGMYALKKLEAQIHA